MKSKQAWICITAGLAAALVLVVVFLRQPDAFSLTSLSVISAESDPGRYGNYPNDYLPEGWEGEFRYEDLGNVAIRLGKKSQSLENAIQSGLITESDFVQAAETDARNAVCSKTWSSKNGLAWFIYAYPDFDLALLRDVYELPNGEQMLLYRTILTSPGKGSTATTLLLVSPEDTFDTPLDQEDWGINFTGISATQTGAVISYQYSGGQQFGTLTPVSYQILNGFNIFLEPADGASCATLEDAPALVLNSPGTITLSWEDIYGTLPAGNYTIILKIQDNYTQEQIPPLSRNYYDKQQYVLHFAIA